MDFTTLGAAIAISKALPDSAAGRAEAAAERAETAAETAVEHGYGMSVENHIKIIEEGGSE